MKVLPGSLQDFMQRMKVKVKVKVKSLSRVQLFVTPWTVAYQAPPSMGFSRQEYWSGLPWRNANQNHNEVPFHAIQNRCYPKVCKQ